MSGDLEVRTGRQIDAALDRIRSKVCLMGMAARWHCGKASEILKNPELLERYAEPLGELDEARFLDHLPALIAETQEQDQRCAKHWELATEQQSCYLAEQEDLVRLFSRFRFQSRLYERLVRQPDKPLVRDAARLLSLGQEQSPEATELQRTLRMRLPDFLKLEEGLANDLGDLDEARNELVVAHRDLAFRVARSQPRWDESTVSSALMGLRKAAEWYDCKHGYSFEEYAQHWVQDAIDKRRG